MKFPSLRPSGHTALPFILFYCVATLCLLFFNKWLFTHHREFSYVLTITWGQQVGVIVILLSFRHLLQPLMGDIVFSKLVFRRVAPVGILAALDYSMSNLALQIIPMSLYEIVKSCAPAVVLLISIVMGLVRPSFKLCLVIVLIVSGAMLAVYHPHEETKPASNGVPPPGTKHGLKEEYKAGKDRLKTGDHPQPSASTEHPQPPVTFEGLTFITAAAVMTAMKSVAAQITLHGSKRKIRRRLSRTQSMVEKTVSGSLQRTGSRRGSFSVETHHGHISNSFRRAPDAVPPSHDNGSPTVDTAALAAAVMGQSHEPAGPYMMPGVTEVQSIVINNNDASPLLMKSSLTRDHFHHENKTPVKTNTASNSFSRKGSSSHVSSHDVDDENDPSLKHDKEVYEAHGPVNPITTTFYAAVVMSIVLIPVVVMHDGPGLQIWYKTVPQSVQLVDVSLIFFSSILSILVSLSSFLVMRETSALTYAVVALGERILIVVTAIILLGESLPLLNASGFGITLLGIAWYNHIKMASSESSTTEKSRSQEPTSAGVKEEKKMLLPVTEKAENSAYGTTASVPVTIQLPETTQEIGTSLRTRKTGRRRAFEGKRFSSNRKFSYASSCAATLFVPPMTDEDSSGYDEEDEMSPPNTPINEASPAVFQGEAPASKIHVPVSEGDESSTTTTASSPPFESAEESFVRQSKK